MCRGDMAFVWQIGDNLLESIISFHHEALGLGDQTHANRLGGKHLYWLSHLPRP